MEVTGESGVSSQRLNRDVSGSYTTVSIKKQTCCANKVPTHSYGSAVAILLIGYLNNPGASFFSSVTANLAYWWVTAILVLFSFQVDRQRFFVFQSLGIARAVLVPVSVLLFWQLSLLVFPASAGTVIWSSVMALAVQMGYWQLIHHVFKTQMSGMVLGCVGMLSLLMGVSGVWWPQAVMMITMATVVLSYRSFAKCQGQIALNGALALAMGVSWVYSAFVLALGTYAGAPVQGLFFCDCWKTMGVVMLADKMRGDLTRRVASGEKVKGDHGGRLNRMLQQMVPVVLASAYVASVLWALYLPVQGWLLPVQVFATVLVTACPCVATLAEPLVSFFERLFRDKRGRLGEPAQEMMDDAVQCCVRRNVGIVKAYYVLSLVMACGGSYALFGVWMTPLSAGLAMLAGQAALIVHTLSFFLAFHLRSVYLAVSEVPKCEPVSAKSLDPSALPERSVGQHCAMQHQSASWLQGLISNGSLDWLFGSSSNCCS